MYVKKPQEQFCALIACGDDWCAKLYEVKTYLGSQPSLLWLANRSEAALWK